MIETNTDISADIGLDKSIIELIYNVLKKYQQIDKAVIFGSRAKGNYRQNSDIDMAIFTNDSNSLLVEKLMLDLDELPLPFKFDIQNYSNIKNMELKYHIDRVGVKIYEKSFHQ